MVLGKVDQFEGGKLGLFFFGGGGGGGGGLPLYTPLHVWSLYEMSHRPLSFRPTFHEINEVRIHISVLQMSLHTG